MSELTSSDLLEDAKYIFFLGDCKGSVEQDIDKTDWILLTTLRSQEILRLLEGCEIIPVAIIIDESTPEALVLIHQLNRLRRKDCVRKVPVVLYSQEFNPEARNTAIRNNLDDYHWESSGGGIAARIEVLNMMKSEDLDEQIYDDSNLESNRLMSKRVFDISFSLLALLLLSPIMALISVAIVLESRGPVFYISKRAGTGYKVFDFLKFRTMYKGADKKLEKMMAQNQYGSDKDEATFFKVKNDPRVTRVGRFLRNTSLDELPQFVNVLRGDMSIVGNRPLPLYEAKMLTKDDSAERFLAPAGITGLWQVMKRGTEDLTSEERVKLDKIYARKFSLLYDLKLIVRTIPIMIQKESV